MKENPTDGAADGAAGERLERPQHDGHLEHRGRPQQDRHELALTVGACAALVGVSVRTLHHWDAIGLVSPPARTWAGHRLYDDADVARLHRVLVYRELGFSLAEIGRLLDEPGVDEAEHLRRQRDLLTTRIAHLQEKVSAVDRMLEVQHMDTPVTPEERAEIFGTDWKPEYQREAEQRWGETLQWAQSQQRTGRMSKADWQRVKADTDALEAALAEACRRDVDPASDEARHLVERHRASIGEFYDCTPSMQVCLTRMYSQDERFTEHYEELASGLTQWLGAAVAADARRHGVDPDTATWG